MHECIRGNGIMNIDCIPFLILFLPDAFRSGFGNQILAILQLHLQISTTPVALIRLNHLINIPFFSLMKFKLKLIILFVVAVDITY